MALSIRKLSAGIGAEIGGVDLTKPLDDATFAASKSFVAATKALVKRSFDCTSAFNSPVSRINAAVAAADPAGISPHLMPGLGMMN